MLQNLRERMQGVVSTVIISLVCITFALCGAQYYSQHNSGEKVVAKVNGTKITEAQLKLAHERLKLRQNFNVGVPGELKKLALQQLINDRVMSGSIKKMQIVVGKNQLKTVIATLPVFQEQGRFSRNKFHEVLTRMSTTESDFLAHLRHTFLSSQLERGQIDSEFVLPTEIDTALRLFEQRRDFGYFVVNSEKFKPLSPTNEAITAYYKQHANEFTTPEKISVAYLQLSTDDLTKTINPDGAQLQNFYRDNISNYFTPKRWQVLQITESEKKLNDIKNQINTGVAFEKFMSAKKPANWLVAGKMPIEFIGQLEKLSIGEVSAVFKSQDGYNIIKLIAVQPAKNLPYASVNDQVRKDYINKQAGQSFVEKMDRLADLVYTNSDSLQPAATKLNLEVKHSELFARNTKGDGLLANAKVLSAAFSEPVLKQGYNSNVIELEPGKVVVLRLNERVPETVQPLPIVTPKIIEKLQESSKKQQATEISNKVLAALQHGDDPKQLARQYGLIWHTVDKAARNDKTVDNKVVGAVFDAISAKQSTNAVKRVDLVNEFVIAKVLNIYPGNPQQVSAERRKEVTTELQKSYGRYIYQLWVDKLRHMASVKIEVEANG